ncbi:MAG TPA: DUF885 domain-containing protein [Mycobacteriales bacterium]|jgi:uncharacterized protein (DUF885 family)|nr:DUF885 domain-containing protein [Mycobacteriales bacterium]
MPAHDDFVTLAEAAVDDVLRLRPDVATWAGDHRFDDRLPDLSDAGLAELASVVRRHLGALDAIATDQLDVPEQVDAAILRNSLEQIGFGAEVSRDQEWDLLSHAAADPLYLLMSRETSPVEQRVHGIAGRLAALPDFLATTRATVTRAPRIHAETALAQWPGLHAVITAELDRTLDGSQSLTELVAAPRAAALAALAEHEQWLRALATSADADPRLGAELFARKLPLILDSPLSAAEILERAQRHLEEQTALLMETAREFLASVGERADGDRNAVIRAALDVVARDAPTNDSVVAICEQALTEATHEVRRLGLLNVPDDPMQIEVMPEFRRGIAVAYCDSPGALEVGGLAYVAISPTPADWSAARVASFYREYNSAHLRDLIVHEAMPGHMLQIAHARRFRGSTRVRSLFASGSFVEGWAVHCERLMAEAGFGGLPVRLSQLKMQLRTTINAILDAGVHAQAMTEAEALDLMMRRGFQEEGEASGKWRRAQLTSGQLSTYFVGYTELHDVLAGLRPDQTLNDVIAHGNPPPRHLPALLAG